jgi:splicing factor 3B subunit 5
MADKLRGMTDSPGSSSSSSPKEAGAQQQKLTDEIAQQQLEALQARYIGTGNADTTRHEWASNIARDSVTSYIGHPPLLNYMSIGLGQCRERTRIQLLERMIQPVGKPPKVSTASDNIVKDAVDKQDANKINRKRIKPRSNPRSNLRTKKHEAI